MNSMSNRFRHNKGIIMDKAGILQKIEESVKAYKEQLEKHEGSTLSAMATGAKAGFESVMSGLENLKSSIMENEKAQKTLDNMKEHLAKLESSIKEGDKKMSSMAVEKMEELLKEYREKDAGTDAEDKDDKKA